LHLGLHHDTQGANDSKSSAGIPIPPSKPKIWSLADTAVCKTPPPPSSTGSSGSQHSGLHGHQGYQQSSSQPPHSQSYLHSGIGSAAAASAAWNHNFSQFVDPAMMRLRHHGNMLGMGYMGLPPPVSQQSFTSPALSAAAAHAVASPSLNSDGVQSSNDTPPHTPPTLKSSSQFGGLGGGNGNGGYNGLHNGYSQMSPNLGGGGGAGGAADSASAASKMLMFNNPSSFKMM
jgi:hypothetical protein